MKNFKTAALILALCMLAQTLMNMAKFYQTWQSDRRIHGIVTIYYAEDDLVSYGNVECRTNLGFTRVGCWLYADRTWPETSKQKGL